MTTIYDAAIRNFQAAADILEALQSMRLDLAGEAHSALIGRPRLGLAGGYSDLTPSFGVCLPTSGRANLITVEGSRGVELRCSGTEWITLEGMLRGDVIAESCYVEMQVSSDRAIIADVFLREFINDGSVRDSGHRECQLAMGALSVSKLTVPEIAEDVTGRRVIIHLRQPTPRLIIDRLAITLT